MSATIMSPYACSWDDIGGLPQVKKRLRQAVEWPLTHADAFKRLGLQPPRGVLLHGPPGCSKTMMARAAATGSKATFIPLSCAQVMLDSLSSVTILVVQRNDVLY